MKKETDWHFFQYDSDRYRMKVEYGIDYRLARRNHQQPYFTMTGEVWVQAGNNRWTEEAAGQLHAEIRKYFPSIARYLKWHLTGPEGPLSYLENAKYWLDVIQGRESSGPPGINPRNGFREAVKFGAFPGDSEYVGSVGPKEWSPRGVTKAASWEHYSEAPWSKVRPWLEARLPKLIAAWVVDMGELGVLEE